MIRVTRSGKDPDRRDQSLRIVGGRFEFSLKLQPPAGHRNPGDAGSGKSSLWVPADQSFGVMRLTGFRVVAWESEPTR